MFQFDRERECEERGEEWGDEVEEEPAAGPRAEEQGTPALEAAEVDFTATVNAVQVVSQPRIDLKQRVAAEEFAGAAQVRHLQLVAGHGIAQVPESQIAPLANAIEEFGNELFLPHIFHQARRPESAFLESRRNDGSQLVPDGVLDRVHLTVKEFVQQRLRTLVQSTSEELFVSRPNLQQEHHVPRVRQRPLHGSTAQRPNRFHEIDREHLAGQVAGNLLQLVQAACGRRPRSPRGAFQQRTERVLPFSLGCLIPLQHTGEFAHQLPEGVARGFAGFQAEDRGPNEVPFFLRFRSTLRTPQLI